MKNLDIYSFLSLPLSEKDIPISAFSNMHLQWFAAEDEGRTFDPTETKLRKAKEEGRVAKTAEIPAYLILMAVTGMIWGAGTYFSDSLISIFKSYLSNLYTLPTLGFQNEGMKLVLYTLRALWPILTLSFVIGILGNVVQFGWAPSITPITPDFSKVQFKFSKWIEKIISVQGWYSIAISILKLLVVGGIIAVNLYFYREKISGTSNLPFIEGITFGGKLAFIIILESALFLLLLGIIDYMFQKNRFLEELKMSYQDIKEEYKETEMSPEVKRRIQSKMQQFMNANMSQAVEDSDVLVTNPTHFAVAMKYDMETMSVPKIMAKGEDEIALKMRKIAKNKEVPIIENKPLARALYADASVGEEIPAQYYSAVVLIFQEVYRMRDSVDG